jgi:tRNA nucleotidyltransferase (CCA-adding enzyme)
MRINRHIDVPEDVMNICSTLRESGYEAYVVGGAVRDFGVDCHDWDIATNALPHDTERIFSENNLIETGIKHGTVTVMMNGVGYEITTYRIDGEYSDGRRPDNVIWDGVTLEDDLSRRDFTVNAMAYDPLDEVIVDLFDGMQDIEDGVIRSVGLATARFATGSDADALRMMRAIRFRATLRYSIDIEVIEAIREYNHLLRRISVERIMDEFLQILESNHSEGLIDLARHGLLRQFLPEVNDIICRPYLNPVYIAQNLTVRIALLLRECSEPENILRRLRLDNDTIDDVLVILDNMYPPIHLERSELRQRLRRLGHRGLQLVIDAQEAIARPLSLVREEVESILESGECYTIAQLAVNGNDIMRELSISPSPEVGRILNSLLDEVIRCPRLNEREKLLDIARRNANNAR